ncbi:hypothetical protein [Sphaerisporangium siamense]|uniref:Uncharacterized protein n=1 Tax=Sphaerisporangium siamense TaxID=795645 RepID=A0A7W7G8K6_9ACTN|nr:hypothetical protein [Sphaerisporangium siamense]MBB4700417.1 hypothetical protein [Sphaerisporangium siamense]
MRRYAERLVAELAAGGAAPRPSAGVLCVPDTWLAPAVEALLLILSGEDALEPLSRAAQLDEAGTALFLCLALAVSGHGDRIHASWLGTAFGDLSAERPVTPGQRALWTAAARGAYGPAGKIFVLRKLDAAGVSGSVDHDLWLRVLAPEEPSSDTSPAMTALPALADVPELAAPVQAAARLSRLLDRCTDITSPRPPRNPPSTPRPEPSEPRDAPAGPTASSGSHAGDSGLQTAPSGSRTAPSRGPEEPSEAPTATSSHSGDAPGPLTPSPEAEKNSSGRPRAGHPKSRRIDLSSLANPSADDPPRPDLPATSRDHASDPSADAEPLTVLRSLVLEDDSGPLKPLTAHLLDDIRPDADPYLAAIAFHVAAPVVRDAAGRLAEESAVAPPSEITVPLLGRDVILRPEGPDLPSLAAAESAIRAAEAARRSPRWLVYGPALLPIVALVLAFTVSELFAVAALVLGGIVGVLLWRVNAREQAEARRAEDEITRLREHAEAAVWALHDYAREAAQRAETAAENLASITRLLRRGPAVADQRPASPR